MIPKKNKIVKHGVIQKENGIMKRVELKSRKIKECL